MLPWNHLKHKLWWPFLTRHPAGLTFAPWRRQKITVKLMLIQIIGGFGWGTSIGGSARNGHSLPPTEIPYLLQAPHESSVVSIDWLVSLRSPHRSISPRSQMNFFSSPTPTAFTFVTHTFWPFDDGGPLQKARTTQRPTQRFVTLNPSFHLADCCELRTEFSSQFMMRPGFACQSQSVASRRMCRYLEAHARWLSSSELVHTCCSRKLLRLSVFVWRLHWLLKFLALSFY
jgi:hypothetical protein